jgi:hypothetical protein
MPVPCICEICSATFSVDPYRIRAGKGKYCSKACMEQSRRTSVTCICLGCSASFTVWPSLRKKGYGKYCSRICFEQAKRVSCLCLACQKTFTLPVSAINKGEGTYCSRTCFNQHRTRPMEELFWSHVDKTETCWLWTGRRGSHGYGNFTFNDGTLKTAHRLAYELTYGSILPGLLICHHCDNPPCVRPDHLFLGTYADNTQDMMRKGRDGAHTHPEKWKRGIEHHTNLHPELVKRGEQNPFAKVTEDAVREIRYLRNVEKWPLKRLAAHFGIGISQVQKIAARTVWQHVD